MFLQTTSEIRRQSRGSADLKRMGFSPIQSIQPPLDGLRIRSRETHEHQELIY